MDILNVYVTVNNKIYLTLFLNVMNDKYYINNNEISKYDDVAFINTPRHINLYNPSSLISYYFPSDVHIKYDNLLIKSVYSFISSIINKFDLEDETEFSISFENNKYVKYPIEDWSNKPLIFYIKQLENKTYGPNPDYYYIKLSFTKIKDFITAYSTYDINIQYQLNIEYDGKNKLINNAIKCNMDLHKVDYNHSIVKEINASIDQKF